MFGADGGTEGLDNDFAHRAMDGFGAFILGRNMFAHSRGAWTDDGWKGWWGRKSALPRTDFHSDASPPRSDCDGGWDHLHFVTDGIYAALERAREVAGDLDIKIGGGVSTVRQYLEAGLVDEAHLHFSPVLLGQGEAMFEGIDLPTLGYRVVESTSTESAMHVVLGRRFEGERNASHHFH